MAFQSDAPFAGFLRNTARTVVFAEAAPASNFLLEERLPDQRERDYLGTSPGMPATGWDVLSWLTNFGNHYSGNIAHTRSNAAKVATFAAANQANHLPIESHQDVVRVESVASLHNLYPGDFGSPAELATELHALIESRQPGKADTFSADRLSRLTTWLNDLNAKRDARPPFAAPYGEVASLLSLSDWATRLRNELGLSHLGGTTSKPLPVVLLRYNLSRAERAARMAKATAWAAVPTVVEAGNDRSGPFPAFFPFPQNKAANSNPFGFGVTVDLSPNGGLNIHSELLHFRIDYELDDFFMIGDITDEISDAQLDAARRRHFGLLEPDFAFCADVP